MAEGLAEHSEDADSGRLKSAHTFAGGKTAVRLHLITGMRVIPDNGMIGTAAVGHNASPLLWLHLTME